MKSWRSRPPSLKLWRAWFSLQSSFCAFLRHKKSRFSSGLENHGGGKTNLTYDISTLKMANFFKFDVDFISEKNSSKFSIKQKTLVGCSYFCNPLCSNSAHLNMANDFFFPRFSTGFQSPAGFAEFHPSLWYGNILKRWTIFCVRLEIFVKKFHSTITSQVIYHILQMFTTAKGKFFAFPGAIQIKNQTFST